jgi:hypothetical protein
MRTYRYCCDMRWLLFVSHHPSVYYNQAPIIDDSQELYIRMRIPDGRIVGL